MENELLSSINELKTIIYALFAIALIWLIGISFLTYQVIIKFYHIKKYDEFNEKGKELLDKECYKELVEFAKDILTERPSHAYALWYLGKAHFALKNYSDAKATFEKIAKTELEWLENVQPYLDKIKAVEADLA